MAASSTSYTINEYFLRYRQSTSNIVYKEDEIGGLHPRRGLPGREAHAVLDRVATGLRRGSARGARRLPIAGGRGLGRRGGARRCGHAARPAQRLPPPEHAGRRRAVGPLREFPLPFPWLDL